MVLTPSTMPCLGTLAPDFSLPDVVSSQTVTRDGVRRGGGLLVIFLTGPHETAAQPRSAGATGLTGATDRQRTARESRPTADQAAFAS